MNQIEAARCAEVKFYMPCHLLVVTKGNLPQGASCYEGKIVFGAYCLGAICFGGAITLGGFLTMGLMVRWFCRGAFDPKKKPKKHLQFHRSHQSIYRRFEIIEIDKALQT